MQSPLEGFELEFAEERHPIWREVHPEFQPSEFNRPYVMDVEFLRLMIRIRRKSGVPFRIVSDAREVGSNPGVSRSAHLERPCRSLDLRVNNSYERAKLIITAINHGIVRFGIYPGNDRDTGTVHLDASTTLPSPRNWTRF